MGNLEYELLSDGVRYRLPEGITVRAQGNSTKRATVTLQKGEVLVPPETGNLGSSSFRSRLLNVAEGRLSETEGLEAGLESIATMFDEHLGEREEAAAEHDRESNVEEFVGTPYRISEEGGFIRVKYTGGAEVPQRVTNFIARVDEQVVRDDGLERQRTYKISGRVGEKALPGINVPVRDFGSMNWVAEHWGLEAHVTAGQHQYAREAVELYSRDALQSYRYAHTGWRVLGDGMRVYLHAGGAIYGE